LNHPALGPDLAIDELYFDTCITALERKQCKAFNYPKCSIHLHTWFPALVAALTLRRCLIQDYVLRRNKHSTLDGQKFLKLPPKVIETLLLTFSVDEQSAYDGVSHAFTSFVTTQSNLILFTKVKLGAALNGNLFYIPDYVPK